MYVLVHCIDQMSLLLSDPSLRPESVQVTGQGVEVQLSATKPF